MWSTVVGEQAAGGVGAVGTRAGREFDETMSRLPVHPLQPHATGIDQLGTGVAPMQTGMTGLQSALLNPPVVRCVTESGMSIDGSYHR